MRTTMTKSGTSRLTTDVEKVALELMKEYRDFAHNNKKNPLDELFFILCSIKRSEKVYVEAYESLKRNFPRYELIATSHIDKIRGDIAWGGLQNQKATVAKEIVRRLIKSFGRPTLAPLKKMSDEECESYLTSLPGVGKKVARCVMLYALNRQVFPVDSHCWRIAHRLGWSREGRYIWNNGSTDMDYLQTLIPPQLRFSLHVNMVSHGRKICTANKPKCSECVIALFCKKSG